jgi:hypothetical protein
MKVILGANNFDYLRMAAPARSSCSKLSCTSLGIYYLGSISMEG